MFLQNQIHKVRLYGGSEGFPGGSEVKASASNAGDWGSIPGSGRSPGEGNGTPLQDSCLENPKGRADWQAPVHGAAESDTTERTHTRDPARQHRDLSSGLSGDLIGEEIQKTRGHVYTES